MIVKVHGLNFKETNIALFKNCLYRDKSVSVLYDN